MWVQVKLLERGTRNFSLKTSSTYWYKSLQCSFIDPTHTVDLLVRIATRYRRIGNGIQGFRFCFCFWMFRMTVDEHLWFYARLKGMPEQDVQREMDQ